MSGPARTSSEAFDLSVKLRQRLRELNAEKERTQAKIDLTSDQLQKMFSKTQKKPRETAAQLDAKVEDLEHQRTKISLALSNEKAILRQINGINRAKAQLEEYEVHERSIQDKKAEISALRDSVRTIIAQVAELESALSKVELAKRLGCSTAELQTRVIDCPEGKVGHVIGKNGATLKQLEEKTGVHVDVDKVGSKIHLHGSELALNAAAEEIENITLAVEEDVELSPPIVTYLVAKRSAAMNKIQDGFPGVYFDLPRNSSIIQIRGRPERVALAKSTILSIDVKKLTRHLTGRETSLVVGKGGSTITKLVENYDVVIDVDHVGDDSSMLSVVGIVSNADAAFAEIEDIIYQNEDVEESITVQSMQRNKLLADSGALVKELQAEANEACSGSNVMLFFEKLTKDEMRSSDTSNLLVKVARSQMQKAKAVVQSRISAYEAKVVTIKVAPDIIPSVIGKGGAKINALRKEGSGAEIEVDKFTGEIKIMADDDETTAILKAAIDNIVADNQVLTVNLEKSMIGVVFGSIGKEMREKVAEELDVYVGMDSADRHIILRGSNEKIAEAAGIVQEFIAQNFTAEVDVPPEDESFLFQGGAESMINKLESEHSVKANVIKLKHLVVVRGLKENVETAVTELNKFFFGGEGYAVKKVKIPDGVLGIVIGKGGSNLTKLESEYEGVTIQIHRESNNLCMRGPEEKVDECRSNIITTVATARVSETVPITADQHEKLSKGDTMKKITLGIPVQVTLTETSVKLRGVGSDVEDARALLEENLTGIYKTRVDLDLAQLGKVRSAASDPSHFNRISSSTNTSVELDAAAGVIVISGKRSNARKAKTYVMGFLDFLLPSQFAKVKVTKALLKSVGEPSALAKIAADTGSMVSLDRDICSVLVQSSVPGNVSRAVGLINARVLDCEKLNLIIRFEPFEAWLFPIIIGKAGATVQMLQTNSGCTFEVAKDELTIAISGETEEAVKAGRSMMDSVLEEARKENVFFDIPESAMPSFIGKSGSNIKQIAEEHDVKIERVRKDLFKIQVSGHEDSVVTATKCITKWLSDWEIKYKGKVIAVDEATIPALLGKEGGVIGGIQKDFGVRIDIDRSKLIVTIRGGVDEKREEAAKKIESIIVETRARRLELDEARMKKEAEEAQAKAATRDAANDAKPHLQAKETQVPVSDDQKKDRSKEFRAVPVGLTTGGSDPILPLNKFKNRKKMFSSAEIGQPIAQATQNSAAKSLFSLLVSEPTISNNPKSSSDEQWDSSTVSSAAVSTGTEESSGSEGPATTAAVATSHFKSVSGVAIRL